MIEILLPNSEEPGNYTSHQRTSEEFDEVGDTNTGDWRNTLVHEFGEIQAALAD